MWERQRSSTYDHVAVVTLVWYQRVEGDGVEDDPPVTGVLRDRAAHGCNNVTVDEREAERGELMFLREQSGNSVGLQEPSAWQ